MMLGENAAALYAIELASLRARRASDRDHAGAGPTPSRRDPSRLGLHDLPEGSGREAAGVCIRLIAFAERRAPAIGRARRHPKEEVF